MIHGKFEIISMDGRRAPSDNKARRSPYFWFGGSFAVWPVGVALVEIFRPRLERDFIEEPASGRASPILGRPDNWAEEAFSFIRLAYRV